MHAEIQPRTNNALSGKHRESGAREVHDHLAGAWIPPANGDVVRRERDDFAAHFDPAVVVGHDLDPVAGLAAVRIVGIAQRSGCGVAPAAMSSAAAVDISLRWPWPIARIRVSHARVRVNSASNRSASPGRPARKYQTFI